MGGESRQAVTAPSAATPSPDPDAAGEAMRHFGAAFLFLLLGIGALIWNGGRLAQGNFVDPRVIGGLHFITLGWLSLSIFGALRVFTGVALGVQSSGNMLASWIRRLWVTGALLFPCGIIGGHRALIAGGIFALAGGLLLYIAHLVPMLLRASRGGITRAFLAVALVSLCGAFLLGGEIGLVKARVITWRVPPGYLSAHILLAVFGWVGATVVGVGAHLLPMFALSRAPHSWPLKLALGIWCVLPIMALLGAFFPAPFLTIGWTLAAIGSCLWMAQVRFYFKARLRKERDAGLLLANGATALLGAAWVLLLFLKLPVPFVGLLVIGWLTLFTLGMYHRIIPFLVWFQRFSRRAGKERVPAVKELLNSRLSIVTAGMSLLGTVVWLGGLAVGSELLSYLGASTLFLGALSAVGQLPALTCAKFPVPQQFPVTAEKRA